MLSFMHRSLILKLLVVLTIILAASFTGLSFFILKKQQTLLGDMSTRVGSALASAGDQTDASLDKMKSHVDELLHTMQTDTSGTIADGTRKALDTEEENIRKAMESLLLKNADGITAMLNSVTPSIIARKAFAELIKYSKAAAATNEIIYTLFLDNDGSPFPGHLNTKDPKVKAYLAQEEDIAPIQKILKYSRTDNTVMVFEFPIEYYGTTLGKTVICMNRDSVISEIESLARRFEALNANNSREIQAALEKGSQQVLSEINKDLHLVNRATADATQNTTALLAGAAASAGNSIRMVIIVVGLACSVLTLVLIGFLLHILVVLPIKNVSDGLKDTAEGEGDLTKRLALDRQDEIGVLAGWFDTFLERLDRIILDINTSSGTVRTAARTMQDDASRMSDSVSSLSERSTTVAAATEEMSVNMESVAAASEQASINVTQVSDAAEQMKTTLNEVAANCDRARDIAGNASAGASNATTKVTRLGQAANEVSKVTQVITDIAEQTNLLALNATIEAARAGESGKGFAVVATEIKGLALETAGATQDIRAKIDGIQASTQETVNEVGRISEVITEVNQIVTSIAAAVEEQSAAASHVAENISQAATGIQEVNLNVSQSSQVSTEIAGDIAEVNTVSETMSQGSTKMAAQAGELSALASTLEEMISVFKISGKD
ncbi:MAG: HAMP domain-containing methyl-accepting chemotaxis protein [Desulfobacter sp.]